MIENLSPVITSVLECALAPAGVFDRNFKYIYYNHLHAEEIKKIFGITCYPGIDLREILKKDPSNYHKMVETWHKVFAGESFTFTHEMIVEGRRTIYQLRGAPVKDDKGNVVGGVHWGKNITTELIRSGETFRATFDHAVVPLAHAGMDGKWVRTNKAFCELLGYANEELGGLSYQKITHPDDWNKCQKIYDDLISGKGKTRSDEIRYLHKKGHVIWVNITVALKKNVEGFPDFFIVSVVDIDQLKKYQDSLSKSEQRFKLIANTLPQMVFLIHKDHPDEDYYNDRWYEYVGLPQNTVITQVPWEKIIHPEDIKMILENWDVARQNDRPYSCEYRLRNLNTGEYRWFLYRSIPIKDENQKVIKWIGTATDINEQKLASNNLQRNLKVREDFLTIASHQLKTPISSLVLSTQMLSTSHREKINKIPEGQKILLSINQIENQSKRLARMVDDMMDITRMRSGKLSLTRERLELSHLVSEVVEKLEPQILQASNGQAPLLHLEEVHGDWDRIRLEQVVINLVTNAIRYGKGNPIEVSVRNKKTSACLSVKDHGIGIAKENQERIFERFERAISPNEISGLGLGLFIVKKIVEAHTGTISVTSTIGKGSEFTIELPLTSTNKAKDIDVS